MKSMKELNLIISKRRQQLNLEKIEIEKKLKASQNKRKVMPNNDDKLQKNVVKESENNKENKLYESPIEVPPLNLPKPNNDSNENSKILIENKNNIDNPLNNNTNNNNNNTHKNITAQQTQKHEKKSKSKTFQGDIRDNEKARLAKLFEVSEPTIISDKNSNKVGNIFRINNYIYNNNNNKMISNNNNDNGSKVSTPLVSKREFEINRLAELFENSETSSVRNYQMQQEIAKKCASNCILPTTSSFLDLPVDHSDDEVGNDGGNYPGSFNPNDDESSIHPINSIHSIPDDMPNEDNDLDRNEMSTSVSNGANISSNNFLAPPKVFVTTPTLTNGPASPNMLMSGLEEQDERRKQFMEQRKKDYFDYMQQARLQMRNSRPVGFCTHRSSLRDVSTQTDFDRYNNNRLEPVPMSRPTFLMDNNNDYNYYNTNRDKITSRGTCTSGPISPSHSDRSNTSPVRSPRGRDLHRSTNCLPGSPFLSPCTPSVDKTNIMETCCDGGISNTHIKQYIYREELKKQIEERQRLEAERKEKEKREEEAIERRVREQQERLRRQYELEEAQRIEYAMRRHIQDDLIRQRLTEADIRTMHNIACNRQRPTVLQSTNNAPFISPDDRPLPLPDKDKKDKQPKSSTTTTNNNITNNNTSSTNPTTSNKQGAINNNRPTKPINLNRSNSNNNNQKNTEIADPLIGVDLLADNGDNLLDDIDNKLTINDNTMPVLSPDLDNDNHTNDDDGLSDNIGDIVSDNNRSDGSKSPVVPALQTRMRIINNSQMLQDKWQVPAVEKTYIRPTALYEYPTQPVELHHQQLPLSHLDYINTNQDGIGNFRNNESSCNSSVRSDNVLTQLGSFRRQLQLEHLRMQERLYNQQLGHQRLQMPNTNPPNIKTATVSTTRS